MGVSFDGGALWCVQAHKMMVLISTHIISKGETLVLLMDVGEAPLLSFFAPRSRSEFLLLSSQLWCLVVASEDPFFLLCRVLCCLFGGSSPVLSRLPSSLCFSTL